MNETNQIAAARRLLRPREVAATLGVSLSKCYLMMKQRELPSVRVGRAIRVPADELARWIDRHISGGPEAA